MATFIAKSEGDGRITLGSAYNRARFREDLIRNKGARYRIERITPESRQQRRFLFGAVYKLWAFLNGLDHRDSDVIAWLHEEAKREFNGDMVMLDGKPTKRGKSSKGQLNQGFLEKIIDYLEENYGIDRAQVLNPKEYDRWVNTIFPNGGPEDYIDYLVEVGRLKRPA